MKINKLAAVLLLVPGLASGAESTDPDWPCIQRKVENLSPGLMWTAPVTPAELSPDARALASKLALRRVSLNESQALIAAYVAAGFHKIHLDCSMSCAGDPHPLPDETVAARSADLARVAERTAAEAGLPPPVYVIGTEVPVPGGEASLEAGLSVTTPAASACRRV